MVALETRSAIGAARRPPRRAGGGWSLAAGGVLAAGLSLRLALGGGGVGDRSAAVMMILLSVGAWLGALLLSTPRLACVVALVAVGVLDLAALPARNAPEYDDRQAFFRTDQVVTARLPGSPIAVAAETQPTLLVLLVEPVFPSSDVRPRFGLAGEVGSSGALAWECAFRRGLQHLGLPLPAAALASAPPLDVRLHLTGSPSRETDYLVVYASAPRGGFLVSLAAAGDAGPDAVLCTLQA